ncbi:MAG: SDR family oxidoreductase [Kiloniellales bacterium]|nr:SDR family oxidoreductase [Kiloniellales bacterium]
MAKLSGKVALVTGAGRGIGQAIAAKLAAEGAALVINDLDEAPAAETVARIEALGGSAEVVLGDVTADDFAERFVAAAVDRFAAIDIVVNNAGYTWDGVIQKHSDQQWEAMLAVHLTAPFRILRAASEFIRAAAKREAEAGRPVHRKVVNISSISGVCGNAGQVNYAAAKMGVVGLTKALAKEWGRYRVNVNCVAFGLIDTRLTRPRGEEDRVLAMPEAEIRVGIPEEAHRAIVAATPLGRAGTPEDAAGAVYLLCTPESDFITGQVIMATGGFMY